MSVWCLLSPIMRCMHRPSPSLISSNTAVLCVTSEQDWVWLYLVHSVYFSSIIPYKVCHKLFHLATCVSCNCNGRKKPCKSIFTTTSKAGMETNSCGQRFRSRKEAGKVYTYLAMWQYVYDIVCMRNRCNVTNRTRGGGNKIECDLMHANLTPRFNSLPAHSKASNIGR